MREKSNGSSKTNLDRFIDDVKTVRIQHQKRAKDGINDKSITSIARIKNVRVRYATGKIDDETYETAMKEFNNRKDLVILELDKCNLNLSNYEKQIPIVIATASNISGLWHNANLENKRKIQNLVFPNGIFWDKQIGDYRTISRNKFFDLMDRFLVRYGKQKEAASSDAVSLCGR